MRQKELHELEQKILDLESRQRLIGEIVRNGFYTVMALLDRDGNVLTVEGDIFDVLGYTPEEYVGLNTPSLLHPEDRDTRMQLFATLIDCPGDSVQSIMRFRAKSGTYVTVYSRGTNLLNSPCKCIMVQFRKIHTSPFMTSATPKLD